MKTSNSNIPIGLVRTMGLLLILATCLAAYKMACAQATHTENADLETKKIHISSQRLISSMADNQAEFIGNVRARQGETQITADSIKIFFSDKKEGDEASPAQSLEKLVATGNVEIKFDNRLAVARQAVYITAKRILILSGPGATITSGENTISGETITFNRTDGRFTVEGGNNGRVKAVILPEASGLE